jgi:hypothetical protein
VPELARTSHWIVTLDDRIVRAQRTATPFETEADLRATMTLLQSLKLDRKRSELGLLVDLREGPFRNDDSFETAMQRYRQELFGGWAAVASIVKTAVGKLQVNRFAREDHVRMHVYNDDGEALAYLRSRLA